VIYLSNFILGGGGKMKAKPITFLLSLTFLFLFSGSVYGDDLQDGLDAYKRKDYQTAYKLLLPLADRGVFSAKKGVKEILRRIEEEEKCRADEKCQTEKERLAKIERLAEEKLIADEIATAEKRIAKLNNATKGIKPERQKEFLNIVKTHADKYAKGKSEIKKSLYRKKRIKAFSKYFDEGMCFLGWSGTVRSLDTDKNGDAILGIDIGGYIFLNYDKQAIPMNNSLFDTVAEMEENDKVVLSGCFKSHNDTFADNWYLFTHEQTEKGAMTSPTFQGSYSDIIRFTDWRQTEQKSNQQELAQKRKQQELAQKRKQQESARTPQELAQKRIAEEAWRKQLMTEQRKQLEATEQRKQLEATEQRKQLEATEQRSKQLEAIKSYLSLVGSKISREKSYPEESRRAGHQGKVKVEFTVLKNGEVNNIRFLIKTHYDLLNQEAMASIKRAAPFPKFPDSIKKEKLIVIVPHNFMLN
jgi:TonB family protein